MPEALQTLPFNDTDVPETALASPAAVSPLASSAYDAVAGSRSPSREPVRMIALDIDGTLLASGGTVSHANRKAINDASAQGVEVVIATGRRHCYALKVLHPLELPARTTLVSSNGAVVRTFGSQLIETNLMDREAARWLIGFLGEFRDALVITFDRVGADGEDLRGALVVERLDVLNGTIGRWIDANHAYIEQVAPLEDCLRNDAPIQMMLCGTVARMRQAEALLLSDLRVAAAGEMRSDVLISLNRTEYPERDLSIVDILPVGCSKGAALLRLVEARGLQPQSLMAIGDNWNDVSMLEIAGYPVLMANAPDDLLAVAGTRAWRMTADNDQDGVAEAIAHGLAGR